MTPNRPQIIISNEFQKTAQTGEYADQIFSEEVLKDLSLRITGRSDFDIKFLSKLERNPYNGFGYNKGRLAYIIYENEITIITFPPLKIGSRNSPFQTIGTAVHSLFLLEENVEYSMYKKKLKYYFVHREGNLQTAYANFMFRAMASAGIEIVNPEYVNKIFAPFSTVEDLIRAKNELREKNSSNKSSHVSLDSDSNIEVYAKTYGANKYESLLLILSCYKMLSDNQKILVYEISDNSLTKLPKGSRDILAFYGIEINENDLTIKNAIRESGKTLRSFRSPQFISSMLDIHGPKCCHICDCDIPQLIEAAHIWPVASIKSVLDMTDDDKYRTTNDGHNGLWLCRNHHKLFDSNLLVILNDFKLYFNHASLIEQSNLDYLLDSIRNISLSHLIADTQKSLSYLAKRNAAINLSENYELVG